MTAARVAADLVAALTAYGLTVATAESLTGGLVAAALTDVPGASAAFVGSVVSYATRLKAEVLGVDAALLAARGAVDPDVAGQMALGVCRVLGSDVGIATTGVAGPDPQDGQPVGTVYVAVAGPGRDESVEVEVVVRTLRLRGDRSAIRAATVAAALDLARGVVAESTRPRETQPIEPRPAETRPSEEERDTPR